MFISRRGFLRLFIAGASGATAAYFAVHSSQAGLLAPLRALYRRLPVPVLEDTPTGPLDVRAGKVLLAATEALVGTPIELSHYEDFFRWRAENRRGYKALYEHFATILNQSARRSAGCDFTDCHQDAQHQVLDKAFQVRGATGTWDKIQIRVLDGDWLLFDTYIVREIFSLFAKTDAWVLLGYESWPGTPRGLERYTQAPGSAR
jgi:hypothetical protein